MRLPLDDVLLRRTDLASTGTLTGRGVDDDPIRRVAEALTPATGWDASIRDREIDRMRTLLAELHGIRTSATTARLLLTAIREPLC